MGPNWVEVTAVLSLVVMLSLGLCSSPKNKTGEREAKEKPDAELLVEAKSSVTWLMLGPAVALLFLSYAIVLNLPVASGGLKPRCAKLAVVAAQLTSGIREALVGDSRSEIRSLSFPVHVYAESGSEYVLWALAARRTITLPKSLVQGTVSCEDNDIQ